MKKIFLKIIEFYQRHISSFFHHMGIRCKFYPTCSEYTKSAILKYGVIKGLGLGFIRIMKCNPFSKGGYDPLK